MSFSFPFTFRFAVPGLPNPFAFSAPAAHIGATDLDRARATEQHGPSRKKRTYDNSFPECAIKRPSGPPPPPLVRKRRWVPVSSMPSEARIVPESPTGVFFDSSPAYNDDMEDEAPDAEEVELDLPPSKRRKGLTGSVVSSAFNTLLVGAAVGLTMYRLWRDRGKEPEQSPPPPYQEEWAPPNVQAQQLPPKPSISQPEVASAPAHRTHVSAHNKRAVSSTRRIQKPVKRVVTVKRESSPRKPRAARTIPREMESSTQMSEDQDEMDWIGDQLSKLIEEGKRALGAEIVVSSEAPEDEVDDGTGDWIEDEEASASFAFESNRNVLGSPSKRNRFANAYSSRSHSRNFSDVASANVLMSSQTAAPYDHMSADTEMSDSPSVREAMDRARASYRQRRGYNATA